MEVYEFDKCLLDRLEESMSVLSWKDEVIPATQVRSEWSYYIELQIEPAGWQAIWKIPRVICEELHIRYPTVVFGCVEQVLFKDLKAILIIQAVQEEDIHLPERHEVFLEDLWPTKQQENAELNIERTADCVDRLRFFYTHVWMPWDNDNDDDLNWVEKHLESRIRFCYDLRKRTIKRTLAAHVRKLLAESKYLQQRREYLEIGLTDEDEGSPEETISKTEVTDLMRLHLRLAMIRNEIELLENPEMRRIYQEIKFPEEKYFKGKKYTEAIHKKKDEQVFIVMMPYTIEQQIDLMHIAKKCISTNALVQNAYTLQDVLSTSCNYDCIYLSPGRHTVRFLENMNEDAKISGIKVAGEKLSTQDYFSKANVVISSSDDDSILFVFDGSFTLENVVMDCRKVRTGIVAKNGTVYIRNCTLIGDGKTSTQQGIICNRGASIILDECTVERFATGIIVMDEAELRLNNSKVINCKIGIDLSTISKSHFNHSKITNSQNNGIYVDTAFEGQNHKSKSTILCTLKEWESHFNSNPPFIGECEFRGCKVNIFALNVGKSLLSKNTLNYLTDADTVFESPSNELPASGSRDTSKSF
ncbi:PREDICTED: SHC SH2 domain-binding protein 1 homolog B [Rhagoletis zephyria]|uniref:SHC SH2 domain-binding protein 1 homolog B n=1 Tax=Rhagoletis zephyria TaxID=28612 RepID=UPI00081182E8|nr:PREDICTED: SHC SH2 domain-binding protein 1 homolog B [Rhagoletis zephyria]